MDSTANQGAAVEQAQMLTTSEARSELIAHAGNRTGRNSADLLADHVLDTYRRAGWPVQRDAMDALLRRIAFGKRDGLRVGKAPKGRSVFGIYETRRAGQAARPYRTLLQGLGPLRASCDCPDFLRGSLGLCKHVLVVLASIARTPRAMKRAQRLPALVSRARAARLTWNPICPLDGPFDWMMRLGLEPDSGSVPDGLAKWFAKPARGLRTLKDTYPDHPRRRLVLVQELLAFEQTRASRAVREPAVKALLRDELKRVRRVLDTRIQPAAVARFLRSLKRPLYAYQKEGLKKFLAEGRLLLADDMGLGKTAQAAAAGHVLFRAGRVQRGLIIVPAALKFQWQREWSLFTDVPIEIVEGSPAQRRAIYGATQRGFLIANYEQVLRDLDVMHGWQPDVIALDEAQRIKNWETRTAATVKALKPPFRLVLTGTPLENRLEELASIMDWVEDRALEPKWRLVPFHSAYADGFREVVGARNLDTLRRRLSPVMLRRRRADILKQLPPRTDTQVRVELTEGQREEHDALSMPIRSLLHRARKRPLLRAEFLRLMQLLTTQRIIANGLAQSDFPSVWPDIVGRGPTTKLLKSLDSPKLLELRELVRNVGVEQGRKIVVFSQWRRMLELAQFAVSDVLADAGLRSAFFTGHEKQARRTQNIVEFHDDPELAVLFLSDAGGVGLNLQRAATCAINLELPWNPAVLEQRIGRIYRIGQTSPIDVYNLISLGCIEERIAALVSDKRALFHGIFDGTHDAIRFDRSGSFLKGGEKLVDDREPDGQVGELDADPVDEQVGDGEIQQRLAAADESTDAPVIPSSLLSSAEVGRLFQDLTVRRNPDGGMRIDATKEAAETLAAVFQGLSGLLQDSQ